MSLKVLDKSDGPESPQVDSGAHDQFSGRSQFDAAFLEQSHFYHKKRLEKLKQTQKIDLARLVDRKVTVTAMDLVQQSGNERLDFLSLTSSLQAGGGGVASKMSTISSKLRVPKLALRTGGANAGSHQSNNRGEASIGQASPQLSPNEPYRSRPKMKVAVDVRFKGKPGSKLHLRGTTKTLVPCASNPGIEATASNISIKTL